MKVSEMFSDGTYLSWTRVMATPVIITGVFSFIWSLLNKYETGLMYSVGLITLALGAKSYQNHTESILQDKIISEVNIESGEK